MNKYHETDDVYTVRKVVLWQLLIKVCMTKNATANTKGTRNKLYEII